MAKLVMTIDSDTESELQNNTPTPLKNNKDKS